MYSDVLVFFLLQASILTGFVSSKYSTQRNHGLLGTSAELHETHNHGSSRREHTQNTPFQFAATSLGKNVFAQTLTTPEEYGNQNKHLKNVLLVDSAQREQQTYAHGKSNVFSRRYRKQRSKRSTSKFTGLVVGAWRDNSLKSAVTSALSQIETTIWSAQSQFSKPFIESSRSSSALLGAFTSELRTNFHGYSAEAQQRRSNDYSVLDLNSLTTLLILQCLTEATLYGTITNPAVANMSIALESLKAFHTHTYPTDSSILTMWPEKLVDKKWVNFPENLVAAQVRDNTILNQLQNLAKTCSCEPARSGVLAISQNTLCKDHFATPLYNLYKGTDTPPDFLTSFSNLALGSLLQSKSDGVYKAQSELWQSANSKIKILIDKLKSSVIILSNKVEEAPELETTTDNSGIVPLTPESNTTSSDGEDNTKNATAGATSSASDHTTTGPLSDRVALENPEDKARAARSLATNGTHDQVNTSESSTTAEQVTASQLPAATSGNSTQSSVLATATPLAEKLVPDTPTTNTTSTSAVAADTAPVVQGAQAFNTPALPSSSTTDNAATTTNTTTATVNASEAPTTPIPATITTTATPTTPLVKVAPAPFTHTTAASKTNSHQREVNQTLSSESYYSLRNYIDHVLLEENAEVILIPSLMTDTADESVAESPNDGNIRHNGRVYHGLNNVNLMTTASTVHALIVASLSGLVKLKEDAFLQKILVSSLRLLTWYMSNSQEGVTMVVLSQFPSRYQLYWTTSRIAFQLNSKQAQASSMFQFADDVIAPFMTVLRDTMTYSILQSITDLGLGQDGRTRVYIDDFIGAADMDDKGKITGSGEDRLFASSMAICALIATWTVQQNDKTLEFVPETNDPVHIAINSLTNYVYGAVTDPLVSNMNAFMSESVKNCETHPARYPANTILSADGTPANTPEPRNSQLFGVNGYIPKEVYQQLLDQPRFGFKTRGGSLEDLNSPTSVFRFWSSPSFTKAVALQAIAQAANIRTDANR